MTYLKTIFSMKTFFAAAVAAFVLTSCGEQDLSSVSKDVAVSEAQATGPTAQSLTISGENTKFVTSVACSSCTYVVAANAKVVDGKELGFKPGSVICLDAALKYGNISFINLAGTADNPITIGNCNSKAGSN